MPLANIECNVDDSFIPVNVETLIKAADARVKAFIDRKCDTQFAGFVPSESKLVYGALRGLIQSGALNGNSFCEWGSGFGTVTCLAAALGLKAFGIELEARLINASRQLATDFNLPAQFVRGSFVPTKKRSMADEAFQDTMGIYPWLKSQSGDAYQQLGRQLNSFDIVFAYPWPGEEYFVQQLFSETATRGSLLLMYHDDSSFTILKKMHQSAQSAF
ncbi:MAG: hypothetical protein KDB27_09595 [Planctomycetales bacterium]|nr:hypothetical protein [Planctomycetales bacterium]